MSDCSIEAEHLTARLVRPVLTEDRIAARCLAEEQLGQRKMGHFEVPIPACHPCCVIWSIIVLGKPEASPEGCGPKDGQISSRMGKKTKKHPGKGLW